MKWRGHWKEAIDNGFYHNLASKGMVPDDKKEPELGPFSFYVEAFYELSTCRSFGMAVGPIPFTAIVQYCNIFGLEDWEEFCYLIRVMDIEFLSQQGSK